LNRDINNNPISNNRISKKPFSKNCVISLPSSYIYFSTRRHMASRFGFDLEGGLQRTIKPFRMNSYDGVQSHFTIPKRTAQGRLISQAPLYPWFPGWCRQRKNRAESWCRLKKNMGKHKQERSIKMSAS